MKSILSLFLITISLQISAQLNAGEIMFVGYNADGSDGFSILALVDIPANTTIYFTDNEWNGSAIGAGGAFNNTGEGELTWSSGASIITAGTVINFMETNSSGNAGYGASVGTISGIINLNASDEVLYAFLGTNDSTPTTFLSAIANDGFSNAKGTLTNTGLTAGTNAISITGDEDVMVYNGSTSCNTTVADCAAAIATASNWTTQDGTGDQSADGTPPNFPADVAPSFGGTALPVELILFKATEKDEGILVQWTTATELNNDHFELYKSLDGVNYLQTTRVDGNGTTSQLHEYKYLDKEEGESKYIYYKLKQVDYDGEFEWFETIVLQYSKVIKNEIFLFPNPSNGSVVYFKSNVSVSQVEIVDMTGKRIAIYKDFTGNELDVSQLTKGHYLIRISSFENTFFKRLTISR